MADVFHREYLVRLPLPLAQLYNRAYNDKSPRSRHDNAFYLFEALVKLTAAPLVGAYLHEIRYGGQQVDRISRELEKLALPSSGHWLAMVRELARHFGSRPEAASGHPLAHLWDQLNRQHRNKPGVLGLYHRIKQGPDAAPAGDRSCSVLQVLEALVQYRNAVFGHGAARFESWYEKNMGPLLFPAVNETLEENVLAPLGPPGTRLVYLTDVRVITEHAMEVGLWSLMGAQGERADAVQLKREEAHDLVPHCVAVLWPERSMPLRLDPLLVYSEPRNDKPVAEVLFLNRDRGKRHVEYLSYTTGETTRDEKMVPAMTRLLSLITGHEVTSEALAALEAQSVVDTLSAETTWGVQPEHRPEPPRQLGDYDILAEIGRGGMGVVYLARQVSLGRIVALKVLPDDLATDEVALARFQREMRALASCDHPNIIKVLTSGTLPNGRLYYAMEYVPGADLEQVWREVASQAGQDVAARLGNSTFIRAVLSASGKRRQESESRYASSAGSRTLRTSGNGSPSPPHATTEASEAETPVRRLPLPPLPEIPSAQDDPGDYVRRVVMLMRDAALALQVVHDHQLIHRDIKPANLILTPDGTRVVLMDFGLVKGADPTLAASRLGGLMGTMRYAAPEQLAAANLKIGPAVDVRGLAVTMWELLTRRRLFDNAQDEKQLAMMIHEMDVPLLRAIDPSFDRDLEAIVARATERRIIDRIPTAGQLADYLQRYLDGQPLPIRPPSKAERLRRWARRRKGAVAACCAGVVLLTAAIAGAWYWDAYHRIHVQYYTNFIKRWGAPEAIGRVTGDELRHRFALLRFTRKGRIGPVQTVETVDNAGNPFAFHEAKTHLGGSDLDLFSLGRKEYKWQFEYNDTGQVINELVFDQADRPVYEFHYSSNGQRFGAYMVGGMVRARTGSGAAHVAFVRSPDGPDAGLEQELKFVDRDGTPKPDLRGVYRVKRKFDARGLVVQETYHGSDGTAMRLADNYARVDVEYDDRGNLTKETYFDEHDKLTRRKEGYASMQRTFDPWGNTVEQAYLDETGNLIETVNGYAGYTEETDIPNRSLTGAYFDAKRNPAIAREFNLPVSKAVIKFDKQGRWQQFDIYDAAGVSLYSKVGIGGFTLQYNERGDVAVLNYVDDKGNPVLGPAGYSKAVYVRDKRGNTIGFQTFNPEGQSVVNEEGVYRIETKYDAQDRTIESAFFDAADKPMANKKAKKNSPASRKSMTPTRAMSPKRCTTTLTAGHYSKRMKQATSSINTTRGAVSPKLPMWTNLAIQH